MVTLRRRDVGTALAIVLLLLVCVCTGVAFSMRLPGHAGQAPRLARRALFINLAKHAGRRAHMERLLDQMGFDGQHMEPVAAPTPWQSLVATHRLCVQCVASSEQEHEYTCIFEDDVELVREVPRQEARAFIERELHALAHGWAPEHEFVKLGACLDETQEAKCIPTACLSWCTHGYMLTPRAARHLLMGFAAEDWLGSHSDYAYMQMLPAPPLVGHAFTHDDVSPGWRGLFFQARTASWYESGMAETGYDDAAGTPREEPSVEQR